MKKNLLYKDSLSLLTDMYQLTMAYAYWKNNRYNDEAVFHLFYRKNPFGGAYAIAAGLESVVQFLQNYRFEWSDIQYLAQLKDNKGQPLFEEAFLNYLQRMEFNLSIDAIPEGSIVFPNEPLLSVKGNLIQGQLIETTLLTLINFPTLIATKASRIVQAAQGEPVLEFGLRRSQGIDGGITASRSAYLGGCVGTSNLLAGKLFHIPVKGTHAHSWVMCFEDELEAFTAYARALPDNCTFLVDTYDTVEGVRNAIRVGHHLRKKGYDLNGIRLDSGDLAALSLEARRLLDEAGFTATAIVASNDLDEYQIAHLKQKGATINVWGVGTRLVTAFDQPSLGGVYKLAAIKKAGEQEWTDKIKLSEQKIKISNPGILQVCRFFKDHQPVADILYDLKTTASKTHFVDKEEKIKNIPTNWIKQDLLVPIFRKGKLVYELPNIHAIRTHCLNQQSLFTPTILKDFTVGIEQHLYQKKHQLIQQLTLEA